MNLSFDIELATRYKSNSQRVRVMSEQWVADNVYCPCCGNSHLRKLKNNTPVSDFVCEKCQKIFELKSKCQHIGTKIAGSAYSKMIERITSATNPELLVLQYSKDYNVQNLVFVPSFFFTPDVIEKRPPLSKTARRAGWIGSNILYKNIPQQGKINLITDGLMANIGDTIKAYNHIKKLHVSNIDSRSWILDVLNCINSLRTDDFYLSDVYQYTNYLSRKHPQNHHIEAKIRQQLQVLRDKGFIVFLGNGRYRKVSHSLTLS